MNETVRDLLRFVEENEVKFIRLEFCNLFGVPKNISIMPHELQKAFENGISFDAHAALSFMNVSKSDLFLHPDPSTITMFPWRPQHGRVIRMFCDIHYPDGKPLEGDGRHILKQVLAESRKMGLACKVGPEAEFYVFRVNEAGQPVKIPQDQASYFDVAPLDQGESLRREICLTLEEMGILPESSHHENGPGQNEIDFQFGDALAAADNFITFKRVVKTIAERNGLFASFLPKPFPDRSGSGLHTNISLYKGGRNIFSDESHPDWEIADSFIQGIINRICEITVFLNPLTNSYERFGSFEAPKYVSWSQQNRSQLIRIPAAKGEYSRMELRSPDAACNPYFAFALILSAGLEGIKNKEKLQPPSNLYLFTAPEEKLRRYKKLPENLNEAIDCAKDSEFIRKIIPEKAIESFLEAKKHQWVRYAHTRGIEKEAFEEELFMSI